MQGVEYARRLRSLREGDIEKVIVKVVMKVVAKVALRFVCFLMYYIAIRYNRNRNSNCRQIILLMTIEK